VLAARLDGKKNEVESWVELMYVVPLHEKTPE
jgi:hypothetical protein